MGRLTEVRRVFSALENRREGLLAEECDYDCPCRRLIASGFRNMERVVLTLDEDMGKRRRKRREEDGEV